MSCQIVRVDGDVLYARISGVMTLADQESLQSAGRGLMAAGRQVRLHVTLENFQGWQKGVDWGDLDFLLAHGDDVAKIAIVGDEQWKEQVFAFVGKGLRRTEIELFPPTFVAESDKWVKE